MKESVVGFMDLSSIVKDVAVLAREVGAMQEKNLGRADLVIDRKSSGIDLVTEIDKQSERMILEYLATRFPEHGILAEESGQTKEEAEYRWVVDPLDGTTNYAQGLPIYCVSIALEQRGQKVLGVVYCPGTDHLFTAVRGEGAFLNGRRLQVSSKTELKQCVLATGFPYDIGIHPLNNMDNFCHFLPKTRAVRRMGAAAYDLACVAAGMFDGFWEMNLSPWDAAAGVLMIEEAGGKVISFRSDRKISIVAGNSEICRQLLDELSVVAAIRENSK